MQIEKTQLVLSNRIANIKIPISIKDDFTGIDIENIDFINESINNSINPVIDNEVYKFKYINYSPYILYFMFGENFIDLINNNWTYSGFNNNDIIMKSDSFRNSFIIMEIFDGFFPQNQDRVGVSYYTKLGGRPEINLGPSVEFEGYSSNQFSYIYIPKYIIDKNTDNVQTYYVRFSFYNAKTGKVQMFYNNKNGNLTTSEKMYAKIEVNKETMNWSFNVVDGQHYTILRELMNAENYLDKINNTLSNKNNKKQVFPMGNKKYVIFDYKTGDYV